MTTLQRPESRIVSLFRTSTGEHVIVDLPQSVHPTFDFSTLFKTCTFLSAEVISVPLHLESAYRSSAA